MYKIWRTSLLEFLIVKMKSFKYLFSKFFLNSQKLLYSYKLFKQSTIKSWLWPYKMLDLPFLLYFLCTSLAFWTLRKFGCKLWWMDVRDAIKWQRRRWYNRSVHNNGPKTIWQRAKGLWRDIRRRWWQTMSCVTFVRIRIWTQTQCNIYN